MATKVKRHVKKTRKGKVKATRAHLRKSKKRGGKAKIKPGMPMHGKKMPMMDADGDED